MLAIKPQGTVGVLAFRGFLQQKDSRDGNGGSGSGLIVLITYDKTFPGDPNMFASRTAESAARLLPHVIGCFPLDLGEPQNARSVLATTFYAVPEAV